jgi:prepilin-type N-terminal cleavage/methylation domain-containing protein
MEVRTAMNTHRTTQRGFTLVELLVVVAIMAVLLGLTIPAFQGTGRGGKLRTAVFQVNSHMNLARQMAITTRQNVYVVFQDNVVATNNWNFSAYAVYAENDGYIGEWRRLPPGVVFHPSHNPGGTATQPRNLFLNSALYEVSVPFPKDGASPQNLYGFTFRRDGRLDVAGFNRKSIFLSEGFLESGNTAPTILPDAPIFAVEIQPVTGQTKVREYN